jgi:hypothetical protein
MSVKWRKAQAWDREHLNGALAPVRWILGALSSIWLAVITLVFISLYGIAASVPIGMLALIPTYVIYGLTAVLAMAIGVLIPLPLMARGLKQVMPEAKAGRFVLLIVAGLVLTGASLWAWTTWAWPKLHWDPVDRTGVRLFADFVETNKAITLRRLPAMEMTELEFYSWWPLKAALMLFVVNMTVATIRRIDFNFKNIGVLTVHTGIITLALGSFWYGSAKVEGDTLLLAGNIQKDGTPEPGKPQDSFYDYQHTALFVAAQGGFWEQRGIADLPRYNDYNIGAIGEAGTKSVKEVAGLLPTWHKVKDEAKYPLPLGAGTLDIAIEERPPTMNLPQGMQVVGTDLKFRVVGYANYATGVDDFVEVPAESGAASLRPEFQKPLRVCYLIADLPRSKQDPTLVTQRAFSYLFLPHDPVNRVRESIDVSVEYTRGTLQVGGSDPVKPVKHVTGMSEERWRDLQAVLPAGGRHGLVIEVAGEKGTSITVPVTQGSKVRVGETGYVVEVKDLAGQPPFPIITDGYKNGSSSVAIVRITTPDGNGFDRWVYHRFPEISQDLMDEVNDRGMPMRRDADSAIRIAYIDASKLQVYLDDVIGEDGKEYTRAIVRRAGENALVIDKVNANGIIEGIYRDPRVGLEIGVRWANSRKVERPEPVAAAEQERELIGTHQRSMLGVEVSSVPEGASAAQWSMVTWLPFAAFVTESPVSRSVELPDGRTIELAFGRRRYGLPGFELQLLDFHMIPNEHRGPPKDYQSLIRVLPSWRSETKIEPYKARASLNEPLTAPFAWSEERSWLENVVGRLRAGLNPNQLKFSQAGWDASTWEKTQKETDSGMAARPYVKFTRLQVGNNPGIHIIALGGILMGMGIPWAFYVKPYLVKREKARIQRELKAGTYRKPGSGGSDLAAKPTQPGHPDRQPESQEVGSV